MSRLLLVRHGQASWQAEDYDVLSDLGRQQSRLLGRSLAARGVEPAVVVRGGMRRHRETAEELCAGAGWPDGTVEDAGWDEYDHLALLEHIPDAPTAEPDPARVFQERLEAAVGRWTGGDHDDDYTETFLAFTGRVSAALDRAFDGLGSGGTAVVVTSGGPVAWLCALLLGGPGATGLWGRLNPVVVNTGVTKLVRGRRGTTLVSFNDHGHLEPGPDLLSYR